MSENHIPNTERYEQTPVYLHGDDCNDIIWIQNIVTTIFTGFF